MEHKKIGTVYLVGAGPGDPKLITLRGKELLAQADTIIYDYLANPALLDFAKTTAEKIYVGKKGGTQNELHQDHISQLMIEAAQSGKKVVRLKGGDPFIFGRGGEESETLFRAGIPFEVVPGVSSAIGVPAYAGIPLTHREMASSLAIITGHEDPNKEGNPIHWEKLATACDTLVLLMGMGNLSATLAQLIQHGRAPKTPIALIQWGTYPTQKTVIGTLETIEEKALTEQIKPPVIMVIGEVVQLRQQINWFESKPLFGKTILITRTKDQAGEFAELLSEQGAKPVFIPTIQIVPPPSFSDLDKAIHNMKEYNTIIFTSVNGVQEFVKRIYTLHYDIRILNGISLCAIGPRTKKEIEQLGVSCDFIPSEFVAEGVLEELKKRGIPKKKFLIPRAMEARSVLPEEIQKQGGSVDVVHAYQTVLPAYEEIEKKLRKQTIDMLTFGSASTVRNFVKVVPPEMLETLKNCPTACIGPITEGTAKQYGLRVDVVPKEYTFQSLTTSIVEYFKGGLKE
jgi:uroporphyrinogen III methyltransferase/synthase